MKAVLFILFIFIKTPSVGENSHVINGHEQMDKQVHTHHIKKLSAVEQS